MDRLKVEKGGWVVDGCGEKKKKEVEIIRNWEGGGGLCLGFGITHLGKAANYDLK